nr:hypothetical protein [uncultured bacterium]
MTTIIQSTLLDGKKPAAVGQSRPQITPKPSTDYADTVKFCKRSVSKDRLSNRGLDLHTNRA